ncbi:MAG: methionine--tRNA ligase [Parcubacteria group bacterium 21-54-25]|nr:MAG: methionine--tRNA ligase [Parcubacteria group bacterium 21-54-25]HQU07514.1 methionine--tRNA ligase [Candidatus Paceibacterota bacterium]
MARYITTTLPYVNADPHIGHALEFVEADTFARALRLAGEETFLNIGTDEHGAKVAQKAREAGEDSQTYVDKYARRFRDFADMLGITYDAFTRTTDAHHLAAAQEFWKRCDAAGDIYKAAYEVKYCVGCELEKTDSELAHGHCLIHPQLEIEVRQEENYYFRFSNYQDALLAHYATQNEFIVPEERMRELVSFVSGGLKDFSISRRKEKLSWGVPVPGDDEHVMYVWFDALVNYVSAIGWPDDETHFTKWWPVTQFAGKDNLRQQAAMWQAMLMSAGLPLSKQIFIHGFITSGGQKMSKTIGNVINPNELVEKYGIDATRYLLLRHAHPTEDTDVTRERLDEWYTANLVNGLGNLVARVMKLAETHLEEPTVLPEAAAPPSQKEYLDAFSAYRFNDAVDYVWSRIQKLDEKITEEEPFKVVKIEREKGKAIIADCALELYRIGGLLNPLMPETSETIKTAVRTNKKPENLFPRLS